MKLYARFSNEKSKTGGMGGDEKMCVTFSNKNQDRYTIIFDGTELQTLDHRTMKVTVQKQTSE